MTCINDTLKGIECSFPALLMIDAPSLEVAAKVALLDMPDCVGVVQVSHGKASIKEHGTFAAFANNETMRAFMRAYST